MNENESKIKVFSDTKAAVNAKKSRSEIVGIQIKDWIFESIYL